MLVLNQGKSQGYDHDIDDEWRDRKIHDQSGYIFHECKATTERLSSIEWADNLDPIHEWDNTLYWTAGKVAHTLDDLIHFRWHASLQVHRLPFVVSLNNLPNNGYLIQCSIHHHTISSRIGHISKL